MSLPFSRDAFFQVFAAYNERFWWCALALWLVTAWTFVAWIRRAPMPRWFIAALLAFHSAWAGLAYHAAFFAAINPAAWAFSGLFVAESALLLYFGLVHRRLQWSHGTAGSRTIPSILIAYALLYPVIARAGGHAYPALPTFGVPCPTTILTIGFLLAADRPWPAAVALVPLVWTVIGGSAAFLVGVRADLMLIVAGMVLAGDMIVRGLKRYRAQGPGRPFTRASHV